MTCRMDDYLGAFVLDALEPDEAHSVAEHVTGCPECRDEVNSLAETAALLALLSADDVAALCELEPLPAVPAKPDRPIQATRRGLLALAAAALLGAAGVGVARELGGGPGGPHRVAVRATDPTTHVRAEVTLTDRSWGTQLHLTLVGAYPSGRCSLLVRARDGRVDNTATWVADGAGAASVDASTDIPADQLAALDVVTGSGALLVRLTPPAAARKTT